MRADPSAVRACVEAAYSPYLVRMSVPPAPMTDDYAALIRREVVEVAIVGEEVVGVIVMWPEVDHLYVDNVAVVPRAQGTGVAGVLFELADDLARSHGRSEIRLHTNEAMVENLDHYRRNGFVETHRSVDRGYRRVYFARPVAP